MRLFDNLLASKNKFVRSIVQRKKNDWELGRDVNDNDLINECVIKFKNILKQNLWNRIDFKDAKIIALTTKVETLQKAFASTVQDGNKSDGRRNEFHVLGDG